MGNPRPGEKSGEGIENPQAVHASVCSQISCGKTHPSYSPVLYGNRVQSSERMKRAECMVGRGGEEIKKGFYFGKNTCQVQTSGVL